MSENGDAPGLMQTLRNFFGTSAAAVQNRVELFSLELKEQKYALVHLLLWSGAALFLGLLALLGLSGTVILLLPAEHRVYGFGGFTLLYLLGALWAGARISSSLKNAPQPFGETISELKKDREWVRNLN